MGFLDLIVCAYNGRIKRHSHLAEQMTSFEQYILFKIQKAIDPSENINI